MTSFDTYYNNQKLLQESFKSQIAMAAMVISLAMTMGIGLDRMGVVKTIEDIRNALMYAQAQGFSPKDIIQQAQQPEVQEQAKQLVMQGAAKSEQMHKKAVETKPTAPPQSIGPKTSSEMFHKLAMSYIRKNELGGAGINYLKPYNDHKGKPTIGVGHLITPKEQSKGIFKKGITEKKALELFVNDIQSKLKIAYQLFPKFDEYPADLRIKLLDGIFRGDVSDSPNTIKLINAGDWEKAAAEFLDNDEYREAVEKGYGTAARMKKIADAIKLMAKRQPQSNDVPFLPITNTVIP